VNKSEPVVRVLAPTSGNAAPFGQPSKGALDDPTTSWECFSPQSEKLDFSLPKKPLLDENANQQEAFSNSKEEG